MAQGVLKGHQNIIFRTFLVFESLQKWLEMFRRCWDVSGNSGHDKMKFRKYHVLDSEKVGKYMYKKVDPGDRVTLPVKFAYKPELSLARLLR